MTTIRDLIRDFGTHAAELQVKVLNEEITQDEAIEQQEDKLDELLETVKERYIG